MQLNENEQAIVAELASAIDRLMIRSCTLAHSERVKQHAELESFFVERVKDNEELQLEFRRRCEGSLLSTSCRPTVDFDALRTLFERVRQLGFSNILDKVLAYWTFARMCRMHAKEELAIPLLQELTGQIRDMLNEEDSKALRDLLSRTEEFLA